MVATSEIKIDVEQADFAAFQAKFTHFKAALEDTPEAWKRVAASAAVAKKEFADAAKVAKGHADAMENGVESVNKLRLASEGAARAWHGMSRTTGAVAKNIGEATTALLKWSGVASVVGGIMGAGAFLGLDRFAARVSGERTEALGTNSTPGRMTAGRIAFKRFFGEDFANKIAGMQRDSGKVSALMRMLPGMTREQIADAEPNYLESKLVMPIWEKVHRLPAGQLFNDPALNALELSHENINTFRGTRRDEAQTQVDRFGKESNSFEYNNPRAWQDFLRALDEAKGKIGSLFINKLAALSVPLTKLTDSFADMVTKLIKSDAFGEMVDKLNDGVKWLADETAKPEFTAEVDNFVKGIGELVKSIGGMAAQVIRLAKWFGVDVGSPPAAGGPSGASDGAATPGGASLPGSGGTGGLRGRRGEGSPGGNVASATAGTPRSGGGNDVGTGGRASVAKDIPVEAKALLDTVASGEAKDYNVMNGGARFSDYSHHPGGRAAGRYQDLPSTWKGIQSETGLKDFSPESQDKGNWYLAQRDYKKHTGRDLLPDLKNPDMRASIGRALGPTWVSLNSSFAGKYSRYLQRDSSQENERHLASTSRGPVPLPASHAPTVMDAPTHRAHPSEHPWIKRFAHGEPVDRSHDAHSPPIKLSVRSTPGANTVISASQLGAGAM